MTPDDSLKIRQRVAEIQRLVTGWIAPKDFDWLCDTIAALLDHNAAAQAIVIAANPILNEHRKEPPFESSAEAVTRVIAERDAAQAELARLREFRAPDYAQIRNLPDDVQHHIDSLCMMHRVAVENYDQEKHARRAVETERDRLLAEREKLPTSRSQVGRLAHDLITTEDPELDRAIEIEAAHEELRTLRAQLAAAQAAVEQLRTALDKVRRRGIAFEACFCVERPKSINKHEPQCDQAQQALRDTAP